MKLVVAVLVVLLGKQPSAGFIPVQNHFARRELLATQGLGVDKADVSIPYDAAARLAYDQWRVDFNKGDFDPVRFQIFKDNYEIVTVANVKAKKKARDEGTVSLSLMSLNEFGDWTLEEYFGAQQQVDPSIGAPQPTTTSDILGKAVEAVELQTEASNALEEAFDALAIEEQKLVEALGLESVDELEEALDSLEGIAPDGGELETSTLAREARIRDAYLKWCKEFNKEPDESRYPRFSQNFLFMEQYIKTTGKEMALNMYADFSKEEYEAAIKGSSIPTKDPVPPKTEPQKPASETTVATKTPSTPEPKVAIPAPAPPKPAAAENGPFLTTEDVFGAARGVTKSLTSAFGAATSFAKNAKSNIMKSIDEGLKEIEESAETEETRQKRLERLAAEQMEFEKAAAAARAERVRAIQERAKQEEERREQIEKERIDRLKMSEKEAAKAKAAAEAMAIANAKAEAERQAEMAARRAYLEAQAVEQTRRKARELDEKLKSRSPIPPPPTKKSSSPTNMFANFFSKEGETKKPPAAKKAPIIKPPIKKTSVEKVSLFSAPKSAAPLGPPPSPPMPTPVTKAPAKISTTPTLSLFPMKSVPAKKESTVSNAARPAPAPRPTMFSPTPAKSKIPAPVQKEEKSPVFSFFSSPTRKEASTKEAPKPLPKPQKVQYSPTLSLFNTPVKPKEIAPAPAPIPEKAPAAFSFFGSPAKPQVSAKPQIPKIPNRAGTISLFGSNPKPKKEQPIRSSPSISLFGKGTESKSSPPPAPKSSGTMSLFGSGKGSAVQKPSVEKAPAQKKAAVTFFGSAKVSGSSSSPPAAKATPPPKNVPILSRWKQNSDGSITGKVSNSPNFNPGTEITTSPVRKGATAGSVVKTGSGSQYYLA